MFADVNHRDVFEYFSKICSIPHGSGNTKGIADYLCGFAIENNLKFYRDDMNNVIIYKNASEGYEDKPAVILQGHSDMVCDSVGKFDFETQPIEIVRDGDIIRANGTTLGADNGIAGAMMLSILADKDACHPALECVFTTDEETGMFGALALNYSKLSGKIMFNLDSDGEGIITCGCAGGASCHLDIPMTVEKNIKPCYKLSVGGLLGGHSGVMIGTNRANAIKLAAKVLAEIATDCQIISISGGSKENAIPSVAEVVFASGCDFDFVSVTECYEQYVKNTFTDTEPSVSLSAIDMIDTAFDESSSHKLIALINEMPTGVVEMSKDIDGLVQTSLNCGVIATEEGRVKFDISVRSNVKSRKIDIINMIKDISAKYGYPVEVSGEYPSWEYNPSYDAKMTAIDVYRRMFGKEPKIEVIHAGLECGVFTDNIPGLDCIAFGPTLEDIHTVNERVEIGSVCRVFEYLVELLKNI